MQEARKFNLKSYFFRLLALSIGALLSWGLSKEPRIITDSGSFFMSSNPSDKPIGDYLIQEVQKSKKSLDIQIYALSDKTLISALNKKAGSVDIQIYYDPKASPDLKTKLDARIKLKTYNRNHLMHRKIMIVDYERIWLGSTNFTTSSLYWHDNIQVMTKSSRLAEFLEKKERGVCHFNFGRAYLLPDIKNQALEDLASCLDSANDIIHLAMFSLTHPIIIQKLELLAYRGVKIYLYLDALNFKDLKPDLLHLMQKCEKVFRQNRGVLMHHKTCLIDNKIFITGSANWSKSGFKKNEEVLVIFDKLEESDINGLKQMFLNLQQEMEDYPKLQAA